MKPMTNGVRRTRSRRQTWGVAAVLLLPVLLLIGLAETAARSIDHEAPLPSSVARP